MTTTAFKMQLSVSPSVFKSAETFAEYRAINSHRRETSETESILISPQFTYDEIIPKTSADYELERICESMRGVYDYLELYTGADSDELVYPDWKNMISVGDRIYISSWDYFGDAIVTAKTETHLTFKPVIEFKSMNEYDNEYTFKLGDIVNIEEYVPDPYNRKVVVFRSLYTYSPEQEVQQLLIEITAAYVRWNWGLSKDAKAMLEEFIIPGFVLLAEEHLREEGLIDPEHFEKKEQ